MQRGTVGSKDYFLGLANQEWILDLQLTAGQHHTALPRLLKVEDFAGTTTPLFFASFLCAAEGCLFALCFGGGGSTSAIPACSTKCLFTTQLATNELIHMKQHVIK